MRKIVLLVLSRPVAAFIAFAALAAGGMLAATRTPLDFLPRMEVPQITIATAFGGLPAADVRELVTIPLEDALSGMGGLKRIRSYSRDGSSLIQLTLDWGTSMDVAALRAREIIDIAYLSLPSQADKPLVLPVDPGEEPILLLGVFPKEGADASLVRDMADREIRSALQQVEGVGSLQVFGGRREFIEIRVDQSLLGRTGQSLSTLADSIGAMNAEYPSGSLDDGDTRYIIKTDGRRSSWKDLADITLSVGGDSGPIRIRDIAVVERDLDERQAFLLAGDGEGIGISVRRNRGYSPVSLSKNVNAAIPTLNNAYHQDMEIRILYDGSTEISRMVRQLLQSGLIGAIAAFLVLWTFLKRLGYAGITLTAIPLSLLGTILGLRAMDITFNIMSLGGLTLGIGMLVDNSVVVLENLVRKAPNRKRDSVALATSEITNSTVGSTLTSIIVFLPLLFLPGLLGELFSDMAWAIVLSLTFSLLISATWIPLLFSRTSIDQKLLQSATSRWKWHRLLRHVLRKPLSALIGALLLLAAGFFVIPGLHFHWLQQTRQSRIDISIIFPSGTTVEHLFNTAESLTPFLEAQPDILAVTVTGGGDSSDPYFLADPQQSRERMDIRVFTKLRTAWTPRTLEQAVRERLSDRTGISITGGYPPDLLSRVMGLTEGQSRLIVPSDSPSAAVTAANELAVSGSGGRDIRVTPNDRKPQLQLVPDRQALSHHGISLAALASVVGTAMNGKVVSTYEESGRRTPIRVRLREEDRHNRKALSELLVQATERGPIALRELTTLIEHEDYPVLYREGRRDVAYLDVPADDAMAWVRSGNGRIIDPEEASRTDQRDDLILLFLLATGLLYVLLGMQFESFSLPVLFLLTQPFALAGSAILLWITGSGLNLNSLLGMLVVLGLSINSAILLYENYRNRIKAGITPGVTVYAGTIERVRPILITGFTTIMALMPVALDFSGKNPQSSLAIAVVGGLTASIAVALIILPLLFKSYFSQSGKLLK